MGERPSDDEALRLLALSVEPITPSLGARGRLRAAINAEARFLPFNAEFCRLFDLSPPVGRGLLQRLAADDIWKPGLPDTRFVHFEAGPALAPLHTGFVEMQPGYCVPLHGHLDTEITLVLGGHLTDDGGRRYDPGSHNIMKPGERHELRASDQGPTLVALALGRIEGAA